VMNQRKALGPAAFAAVLFACAGLGCNSTGATPDCAEAGDCFQPAGPSPVPPDTGAAGAGGQTQDAGQPDTAAGGAAGKPDATVPDGATPDGGPSDAGDAAPVDARAG
jgi:hypothetical protein